MASTGLAALGLATGRARAAEKAVAEDSLFDGATDAPATTDTPPLGIARVVGKFGTALLRVSGDSAPNAVVSPLSVA